MVLLVVMYHGRANTKFKIVDSIGVYQLSSLIRVKQLWHAIAFRQCPNLISSLSLPFFQHRRLSIFVWPIWFHRMGTLSTSDPVSQVNLRISHVLKKVVLCICNPWKPHQIAANSTHWHTSINLSPQICKTSADSYSQIHAWFHFKSASVPSPCWITKVQSISNHRGSESRWLGSQHLSSTGQGFAQGHREGLRRPRRRCMALSQCGSNGERNGDQESWCAHM